MTTARDIEIARARACYLFRALWRCIDWESLPQDRRRRLKVEATDILWPLSLAARSTLEMVRKFAERFAIDLAGADSRLPVSVVIHERFVEPGTPSSRRDAIPAEHLDVRWDHLVRQLDYPALRLVLHEGPAEIVTFAVSSPVDGEDASFVIPDGVESVTHWSAPLPKRTISPRVLRTVWTTMGPMHHGADEKSGNVQTFRRQRIVDPTSGAISLVPFVSGNAVRGQWRDLLFGRMLERLGMTLRQLPPDRAHSLSAGGTVETGADSAKVDVSARIAAREKCPGWDLLAGCIDRQIMESVLRVQDVTVVCRENAWMVHEMLAPKRADGGAMSLDEFANALKPADGLTQLRLLTRHVHREIGDGDGVQMLANTEGLLPGTQLVHSLQVQGMCGVSEMTLSCLADLLEEFRDVALAGAQVARGYGRIAFDQYRSADVTLPSPDIYRSFLAERGDEIRSWLMRTDAADGGAPKRGRSRTTKTEIGTLSPAEEA